MRYVFGVPLSFFFSKQIFFFLQKPNTYHRIRLLRTRTLGTTVPDGTATRMLQVLGDLLVGRRNNGAATPAALGRSSTGQAAARVIRFALALPFRCARRFFGRVRVHLLIAVRRTFGENNHRISTEKKRHLAAAAVSLPHR